MSAAILALSMGGCATAHSDRPVILTQCPPLVDYDKDDQQVLAAEIAKLPPDATIPEFLNDYSKLRDICRRIKKLTTKK